MEEWFAYLSDQAVLIINVMALIVVFAGTVDAFVSAARYGFRLSARIKELRGVWVRYSRWLVAGLTFQLAADIIESSMAPEWDDIGKLAAIAVIRTFLNYFLERDIQEISERDKAGE
jgi:uncharacterized membrane protein